MYGFFRCPECGKQQAQRSRTRGFERVVKHVTRRRPYRCAACGWRGWCRANGMDLVRPIHRHWRALLMRRRLGGGQPESAPAPPK